MGRTYSRLDLAQALCPGKQLRVADDLSMRQHRHHPERLSLG
jgi:hypothetical protein